MRPERVKPESCAVAVSRPARIQCDDNHGSGDTVTAIVTMTLFISSVRPTTASPFFHTYGPPLIYAYD